MHDDLVRQLNSLEFVNCLYFNKKAHVGNYVIEVSDMKTMDQALIVRNILLLLNSDKRLDLVDIKPIEIAGWITVRKVDKEFEKEDNDITADFIDAVRFALDYKQSNKENDAFAKKAKQVFEEEFNKRRKEKQPVVEVIEEVVETKDETPKPFRNPKIPDEFYEDMKTLSSSQLAKKYGKSTSTIRRWKRESSK